MKIKSLLLGSAAALAAVSGARAADAVVIAEPEPVEYVRVCDAYGAGFFYIPGTETCLRISGYVWYQVAAGNYRTNSGPGVGGDTTGYYDSRTADGWMKSTRARVNIDARQETEWGSLRSRIRLQSTWGFQGDGPTTVDQAYIELGGLMMGYSESFWADSKNGGPSNYGSHSWGGMYYGYQQRHLIGYRFDGGNGFFGAISLEDDTLSGRGYMPDVVAKIGISQGWGAVWVKVAYDESFDGTVPTLSGLAPFAGTNSGGFGAQLGAQINIPNMPGSSLRAFVFYADGAHAYNVGSPSAIFGPTGESYYGGAEWSVLVSYNHQFSSTLGASVAFQWWNDLYYAGSDLLSGADAWGAEFSLVWMPVSDFEVRAEIHYDDVGAFNFPATPAPLDPDGTVSGYLRFTRYF